MKVSSWTMDGTRRLALGAMAAVLALGATACTTIEGTNALTSPATFEREVMRPTLQGVGLVPTEDKPIARTERAPLVVPGNGSTPPPPQAQTVAAIPSDSDQVTLDASGLTSADLEALRSGRVVDVNSVEGRPLTQGEARQLAARMQAYRRERGIGQQRSIYLPPEDYFTSVGGEDTVCLAANGDLVPVNSADCPAEVRAQLANRG